MIFSHEAVNRLLLCFAGVKVEFEFIDIEDCVVTIGLRKYVVFHDLNEFLVNEVVAEDYGYEVGEEYGIECNNFSQRIAGILNGLKRNEAGEMVPVGN